MTLPIALIIAHYFGDFRFQTDWMATRKSWDIRALLLHVFIYTLCFAPWGLTFMMITFMTHLATDAITSQLTTKFFFFVREPDSPTTWSYRPELRHMFFETVGIDQLIHFVTLALTYHYIWR